MNKFACKLHGYIVYFSLRFNTFLWVFLGSLWEATEIREKFPAHELPVVENREISCLTVVGTHEQIAKRLARILSDGLLSVWVQPVLHEYLWVGKGVAKRCRTNLCRDCEFYYVYL